MYVQVPNVIDSKMKRADYITAQFVCCSRLHDVHSTWRRTFLRFAACLSPSMPLVSVYCLHEMETVWLVAETKVYALSKRESTALSISSSSTVSIMCRLDLSPQQILDNVFARQPCRAPNGREVECGSEGIGVSHRQHKGDPACGVSEASFGVCRYTAALTHP